MILNSKEKKDLAIKLIEQGVSTKEMAKQTHLSLTTIGEIRKEIEGNIGEKNKKPLSMNSQAFKLFEKNKSLIQVVIELDLEPEEVSNIHSKYLRLQHRQQVKSILDENKNELEAILQLFNILKEKKINIDDFISMIDFTNDITNLKSEKEQLEYEIDMLIESKKYWQLEIKETKNKFYNLQNN